MKRIIYVAGVNRKHLAAAAAVCPYWLLSVTLLIKPGLSLPEWLLPYLKDRHLLYDPGTFSDGAVSYQTYRRFLEKWLRKTDTYLQYDEIGDPEATAWYLQDMRRRGFKPIPVLQPGGDLNLLKEPHLALGGWCGWMRGCAPLISTVCCMASGVRWGRCICLASASMKSTSDTIQP